MHHVDYRSGLHYDGVSNIVLFRTIRIKRNSLAAGYNNHTKDTFVPATEFSAATINSVGVWWVAHEATFRRLRNFLLITLEAVIHRGWGTAMNAWQK